MKYLITLLVCILLISCNEELIETSTSNEDNQIISLESIKNHLEEIPNPLTIETAVELGYFVVDDGKLISNQSIVDDFINHVTSEITFVYFTDTGDPIITIVGYGNNLYMGILDASRDNVGESIYKEFEYTYLKVFEEDYQIAYHLTNDPDLTFEILMTSFLSSQSTDHIDQQLLIYFEVKDE